MKLIDYMMAKPKRIYITYLIMFVIGVIALYYAHTKYIDIDPIEFICFAILIALIIYVFSMWISKKMSPPEQEVD